MSHKKSSSSRRKGEISGSRNHTMSNDKRRSNSIKPKCSPSKERKGHSFGSRNKTSSREEKRSVTSKSTKSNSSEEKSKDETYKNKIPDSLKEKARLNTFDRKKRSSSKESEKRLGDSLSNITTTLNSDNNNLTQSLSDVTINISNSQEEVYNNLDVSNNIEDDRSLMASPENREDTTGDKIDDIELLYRMDRTLIVVHNKVNHLINIQQDSNEVRKNYSNTGSHETLPKEPLKTVDELEAFEEDFGNNHLALEKLKRKVTQKGGKNVAKACRAVMEDIMTNTLAREYSWKGIKGNRKFENKTIAVTVIEELLKMYKGSTENEIKIVIQDWFRKAGDRIKRNIARNERN
ncbi:uncharacterized protein LOC122503900 [Leptopilina heterotoma]|uniref:uncharacterized protein LOC122503900 n=1 Tax=Leptopilina heterotoma TaxID=63436 RepID=UPI001CA85A86|nr:uncharacterized protein LOC122503900 [Leptopilina heterotoma]